MNKLICNVLLGALAVVPALAQEEEPVTTIEDVLFVEGSLPYVPKSSSIATKLPLPLQQTPASVGVVSAPLLEEQGSLVLGDALRNISGVNVQTQSGVADYFVVRGLDSIANGLVMVDGAPEPEISFYQLYNVERVEVLKGTGGSIYGANPVAAAINLVRKQPEPSSFLNLGLTGGSFGTFGGNVDWNTGGDGPFAFRLNGLWRGSDGHRDGKESTVRGVNPAFSWRPGDTSVVNVSLELLDTEYMPDAGLPIVQVFAANGVPSSRVADVPREREYDSPYDRSEQETRRGQIDYENVLSDRLTVRNKTYYRRLDWLSNGTIFNGVIPDNLLFPGQAAQVIRTLTLLDDRQEFFGDQLEAVISAQTGAVSHEILAGVELAQLDDTFTLDVGLLPTIGLNNPVETAAGPVQIIPDFSQAADASSRVIAPYITDKISLSDKLSVVAGLRFDSIDYEDEVNRIDRSFSELSPSLGIVYSPRPNLSLYASSGQSFSPPSSRVVEAEGERERQPEESDQVEVGAKADLLGGRLQTTVAVYRLDRENVAIPNRNGITQQTGSQRSRGVELELAAEPLPRLRTFFSYAYTDAEVTRLAEIVRTGLNFFEIRDYSGNTPAFAPEHTANLWVSRRFGNGLGVAGGGRYLSEQFIYEDNAFELDASFTLDAAVFYERGTWKASLQLKNLTDEEYFTRGFGNTSVIPAPGFAVFGGFEYRLAMR